MFYAKSKILNWSTYSGAGTETERIMFHEERMFKNYKLSTTFSIISYFYYLELVRITPIHFGQSLSLYLVYISDNLHLNPRTWD